MHPGMPLGRNRLRRSRDAPMWVSTPRGADELAAILKELLPMLGTKPLEVNLLDEGEQSKVPGEKPTTEDTEVITGSRISTTEDTEDTEETRPARKKD